MAGRVEKTNAMRLLDARKVPYEIYTYDPAIHSAVEVAAVLGLPPEQVYKTLVMLRERGRPLLVMVPGNAEVDPRRLARSLGERSVRMAPRQEAERLTGLQVGGIAALALVGKPFDVYLDRSALAHERILVNGGRRGLNLGIAVKDLIDITGARLVDAIAYLEEPELAAPDREE
jgi:Cys-tRNA(Pro)/Cys-tRNA(Cys) deacylase